MGSFGGPGMYFHSGEYGIHYFRCSFLIKADWSATEKMSCLVDLQVNRRSSKVYLNNTQNRKGN